MVKTNIGYISMYVVIILLYLKYTYMNISKMSFNGYMQSIPLQFYLMVSDDVVEDKNLWQKILLDT